MTVLNWHQRAKGLSLSIRNFIDGEFTDLTEGEIINKYAPRDGCLLYTLTVGTDNEVNTAVLAAQQAYADNDGGAFPCISGKRY